MVDVSGFLSGQMSVEERGYNTGPQIFDIWDPVRVEMGSQEIVTIKHEVYDL